MQEVEHEWPEVFPEDCPPLDADLPQLRVFRFTSSDTVEEGDFEPSPNWQSHVNSPDEECEKRFGISVVADEDGILQAQKQIPGMKKKYIASGELRPEAGRIRHTPRDWMPSHHTWWICVDFDPTPEFHVIHPPL